jgi:hypothetical protein
MINLKINQLFPMFLSIYSENQIFLSISVNSFIMGVKISDLKFLLPQEIIVY